MSDIVDAVLIASGLLAAVVGGLVGLVYHRIEKRLDREAAERKKHEEDRKKYELFQIRALTATMELGKANAIALKNGKCNGETTAALEYLSRVKHDLRDFLDEQGVDHLL